LKEGAGRDAPVRRLLNFVLVDSENGAYPEGVDVDALERLGVQVIDTHLASADGDWRLDPEALLGVLLSLA
jgi:hypothetical protein